MTAISNLLVLQISVCLHLFERRDTIDIRIGGISAVYENYERKEHSDDVGIFHKKFLGINDVFWYKKRDLFSPSRVVIDGRIMSSVWSIEDEHMTFFEDTRSDSLFSSFEFINGEIRGEDGFLRPISERFLSVVEPIESFFYVGWREICDPVIIVDDIFEPRECFDGVISDIMFGSVHLGRH